MTMRTDAGCRILLVDDDVQIVSMLKRILELRGYEVDVARNGEQAIACASDRHPHLVLLDHRMPGMDGRTVCRQLRARGVASRIIMLTSANRIADRVAGLDAGADDYLGKPFEIDELLARIRVQERSVARRLVAMRASPSEGGWDFRVLGDFEMLWRGEVPSVRWGRKRPRDLLRLLLIHYDRVVSSDAIIEAFWGDHELSKARINLHVTVQRMRRALQPFGEDRLETRESGYVFHLLPGDSLDLQAFDRLADAISQRLGREDVDQVLVDEVQQLNRIYRGDLYSDEPYAEWTSFERERIRSTFVEVTGRAAAALRSGGWAEQACTLLRRLVDAEPTHEQRACDLAECLMDLGDAEDALAVLERVREVLKSELSLNVGARWKAVRARIA